MCTFTAKDLRLMQDHKESHMEQADFKCLMCDSIFPNLESFKKHKRKHNKELNIGKSIDYPMNVYNFKCTPCQFSFKTHDDLMDHMCNLHLTKDQRFGTGLAKNSKPLCENGPQCRYHRQDRCKFDHPLPAQRQELREKRPRQSPNNQWQEMHSRWPNHHGQIYEKTHEQRTYRNTLPTWCQHEDNCMQGRFCVLREENFTRQSPHRRQ